MDVGYGMAPTTYLGRYVNLRLTDTRAISENEALRHDFYSQSIYIDPVEAP